VRVAIIGAGPAGLLMGSALARRGHEVVAVDRDPGPPAQVGEVLEEEWPAGLAAWTPAGAEPFAVDIAGRGAVTAGYRSRPETFERRPAWIRSDHVPESCTNPAGGPRSQSRPYPRRARRNHRDRPRRTVIRSTSRVRRRTSRPVQRELHATHRCPQTRLPPQSLRPGVPCRFSRGYSSAGHHS
jgi:FAD binding domain